MSLSSFVVVSLGWMICDIDFYTLLFPLVFLFIKKKTLYLVLVKKNILSSLACEERKNTDNVNRFVLVYDIYFITML